jgi:hypothetical protein
MVNTEHFDAARYLSSPRLQENWSTMLSRAAMPETSAGTHENHGTENIQGGA